MLLALSLVSVQHDHAFLNASPSTSLYLVIVRPRLPYEGPHDLTTQKADRAPPAVRAATGFRDKAAGAPVSVATSLTCLRAKKNLHWRARAQPRESCPFNCVHKVDALNRNRTVVEPVSAAACTRVLDQSRRDVFERKP
jgi:hypothetical protein